MIRHRRGGPRVDAWRAAGEGRSVALHPQRRRRPPSPSWSSAGWIPTSSTDQTAPTTRRVATCRQASAWGEALVVARARPPRVPEQIHGIHRRARAGDARLPSGRSVVLRLRQQHPVFARDARVADAFDPFPGFVPAPSSGRSSARGRGHSAGRPVGHPKRHPQDGCRSRCPLPGRRLTASMGCAWPEEKVPFQGLPARICWPATANAPKAGAEDQRYGAVGRAGGPIVIGRDPSMRGP